MTVWDARSGEVSFRNAEFPVQCSDVDFSADGRLLAVACGNPTKTVHVFKLEFVKRRRVWSYVGKIPGIRRPTIIPDPVQFAPSGTRLVRFIGKVDTSVSYGIFRAKELQVWNVDDIGRSSHVQSLSLTGQMVGSCRFLDHNRVIFAQPGHPGPVMRVINLESNSIEHEVEINPAVHRSQPYLDVSADRKHVAVGGDGFLVLIDTDSMKISRHLAVGKDANIRNVAFSPDATLFASVSTGTPDLGMLRLWNRSSGKLICEREQQLPHGVAFSPDGSRLATAGHPDDGVRLWEVAQLLGQAPATVDSTRFDPRPSDIDPRQSGR